jgi:hypothetical protein
MIFCEIVQVAKIELDLGSEIIRVGDMSATLDDLDGRVTALEGAQNDTTQTMRWAVAKLGRIQAVQDEHTLRLERLETKVDRLDARIGNLDARIGNVAHQLAGLIESLPQIVADAVRSARR